MYIVQTNEYSVSSLPMASKKFMHFIIETMEPFDTVYNKWFHQCPPWSPNSSLISAFLGLTGPRTCGISLSSWSHSALAIRGWAACVGCRLSTGSISSHN